MSIQNIANRLYPKTIYPKGRRSKTIKTNEAQETVLLVEKKDESVGLENWWYWNCKYSQRMILELIFMYFYEIYKGIKAMQVFKTKFFFLLLNLQCSTLCFTSQYLGTYVVERSWVYEKRNGICLWLFRCLRWRPYYGISGNTLAAADSQIWNQNTSYTSTVQLLLTKVTSKKIPSFSSTLIKYCVCSW